MGADEFLIERCLMRAPWLGSALEVSFVRPLVEHDRSHGGNLLPTLETYVDSKLSRKATARILHVHPNTVDNRLRQIHRVAGLTLSEPRDLVLAMLALTQRELSTPAAD